MSWRAERLLSLLATREDKELDVPDDEQSQDRVDDDLAQHLPAAVEVEPNTFKPVELCSTKELQDAALAFMQNALMEVREAVGMAKREGGRTPESQALMQRSDEHREAANSLERLVRLRHCVLGEAITLSTSSPCTSARLPQSGRSSTRRVSEVERPGAVMLVPWHFACGSQMGPMRFIRATPTRPTPTASTSKRA